ncbi:MAG: isoprenoid biosynthesis protein ElbB [Calditrichaeota bacterium]|nr:MAG: isoprenoid biosynthesis protein ElbB [Calditrichota bacterium]
MAKVGVILSGCGFLDGAEIYETVLTLLHLDKAGAEVVAMAPDKNQHHVVNHIEGEETGETRNILVESSRLMRGNIKNINEVEVSELDALILPGGFGVAKNFCSFAFEGPNCSFDEEIAKMVLDVHNQGKPVGAICISPALIAKIFEKIKSVKLTIGTDEGIANAVTSLNANHIVCEETDCVVDIENKIVTTPAYNISGVKIANVEQGISKLVSEVLSMIS